MDQTRNHYIDWNGSGICVWVRTCAHPWTCPRSKRVQAAGVGTSGQGCVICLRGCVGEKKEWVRTFEQDPPPPSPSCSFFRHAANCIGNTCTGSVPWGEEEREPRMSICFLRSLLNRTQFGGGWGRKRGGEEE